MNKHERVKNFFDKVVNIEKLLIFDIKLNIELTFSKNFLRRLS